MLTVEPGEAGIGPRVQLQASGLLVERGQRQRIGTVEGDRDQLQGHGTSETEN